LLYFTKINHLSLDFNNSSDRKIMKIILTLFLLGVFSFSFSQRPKLAVGNYSFDNFKTVVKISNNKYVFTFITDWGMRVEYRETYFNNQLDIMVVYNSEYDDQLKINVNAQSFRVWDGSFNWAADYPYAWKAWYWKL
jgi:hypothetical protein